MNLAGSRFGRVLLHFISLPPPLFALLLLFALFVSCGSQIIALNGNLLPLLLRRRLPRKTHIRILTKLGFEFMQMTRTND